MTWAELAFYVVLISALALIFGCAKKEVGSMAEGIGCRVQCSVCVNLDQTCLDAHNYAVERDVEIAEPGAGFKIMGPAGTVHIKPKRVKQP